MLLSSANFSVVFRTKGLSVFSITYKMAARIRLPNLTSVCLFCPFRVNSAATRALPKHIAICKPSLEFYRLRSTSGICPPTTVSSSFTDINRSTAKFVLSRTYSNAIGTKTCRSIGFLANNYSVADRVAVRLRYGCKSAAKCVLSTTELDRIRTETNFRYLSDAANNRTDCRASGENLTKNRPSYTADWSKQELLMATGRGLWPERPDGVSVIAGYVDTAAQIDRKLRRQMPTALLIPSGISDRVELKPLLELMVKDGWRMVIPDSLGTICLPSFIS